MRVLTQLWVSKRKGCRDQSPSNSEASLYLRVRYCISYMPCFVRHIRVHERMYTSDVGGNLLDCAYPCTFVMTCMHLESRNSLNTPAGSDSKLYVSYSANLTYTYEWEGERERGEGRREKREKERETWCDGQVTRQRMKEKLLILNWKLSLSFILRSANLILIPFC